MQYDENAEKYGYEGEMTPLKCDELKAYKGDVYIPVYGSIADADVYLKEDVDEAIKELKAEVNNLLMQNHELCQALQVMYSAEEYTTLQAENAELKQKLEDAKASHYAEMVDAGMRERRLRRALWLSRALRARDKAFEYHFKNNVEMCAKWDNVHLMLMAKAEEYK